MYGRTCCDKDDPSPSLLTLRCAVVSSKHSSTAAAWSVGARRQPSPTIQPYDSNNKIALSLKGTKRHNDAALAVSLSLLLAVAIHLNGSDKHNKIRNAMIAGLKAL